jgi:putative effector of murein hydrolase
MITSLSLILLCQLAGEVFVRGPGLPAHGIGTAWAFQVDAVAGVFAGIAMSLNALVTSLLVPLVVTFLLR